jgi:anti-sigma-K factor RskA
MRATSLVLALALAVPLFATDRVDPYVLHVETVAAPSGWNTVTVVATERATGTVVFSPRVQVKAGGKSMTASSLNDDGKYFMAEIGVDANGKAAVSFKAFNKFVQDSRLTQ